MKIFLTLCFLAITMFAQEKAISTPKVDPKPLLSAIEVPSQMQEAIRAVNKDLEVAQLKKDNVILQLRLILKIPNEFSWDESSMSFKPPVEKKEEKKGKP